MKIVINNCFGGFSLSPKAIRRLAELNDRECYFFTSEGPSGQPDFSKNFPIEESKISGIFFNAFDIPNPDKIMGKSKKDKDGTFESFNEVYDKHNLTSRPEDRTDLKLIQVVEELGDEANGQCARLRIVEIPDGTQWEIDEYDGNEHVEEVHQKWY